MLVSSFHHLIGILWSNCAVTHNKSLLWNVQFSFEANLIFSDLPSPNPLPQLYQQNTSVGDWPEQVEFHPYSAEQESELGYMDDPYHEEIYEDLITPSFFSLERDTLHIVEVTHTVITKAASHRWNGLWLWWCILFPGLFENVSLFSPLIFLTRNLMIHLTTALIGWRRTQSDGEVWAVQHLYPAI